ncbi:hypothetical protein JX266_009608 [Neoarthrinium moseri]|nr:hypothetical protein JX266_009608 [Neoarthrinium moseri]
MPNAFDRISGHVRGGAGPSEDHIRNCEKEPAGVQQPRNVATSKRWAGNHDLNVRHAPSSSRRSRRKPSSPWKRAALLGPLLLAPTVSAVFLPFDNCLPDNYIWYNKDDGTAQLQWVPVQLDAKFDLEDPNNLLITVWGNVTGKVGTDPLPPWNSTEWINGTQSLLGKIQDEPIQKNATTLHSKVDVASYKPFSSDRSFCENIQNGSCPLGPVWDDSITMEKPYGLPYFNMSHNFSSTYAFASFAPTFIILYGDESATRIGCVSATVTPSLGGISWFLRFLPLFVLLLVAFATIFAAVFSPWGTSDVFHWTSNYGRDHDLLRLVTPGFGDCIQYIQFIVLTGGLTLNYPGFYQPAVSNAAWSSLMFNESFVAGADPWESLVDGVYVTNGTLGMQRLSQLVGMAEVEDIWAGMMIWLLVIIGAVLVAVQLGFVARWLLRFIKDTPEEDLRAKNMPFSMGVVIRLVFNYFLLPIVALSTFQLVVAAESLVVLVAMAVVTLALIIGFASYLMYLIVTTKPRAHLFDDLPTVLLYGPLYNTYSDEAAPFALVPIILTFIRGIAIGAVQLSGIAQIVILAVCEVIQMLTIHAFRPFHSPTNMNAYHTGFSLMRFLAVILMVAFAPSMGVTEGQRDWIGYVILLFHGAVLVFGFFLNALQTTIEVIARMCGAGGDDVRGQTRGGLSKIFGARQLQRRVSRRGAASRQSQLSTTGMLDAYNSSKGGYGRVRSDSAGTMGILLHNQKRSSSALDGRSMDGFSGPMGGSVFTPTTPGADASTFSFVPSPGHATRPQPAADPYYRPPRARRNTNDDIGASPPGRGRGSIGSIDLADRRLSQAGGPFLDAPDFERSGSGRATPTPAPASYMPVFAPRADYSTREVDFYYGVRGPALNSDSPGRRRMGTGPADPTSPVATATGWIKSLFGGKTKEKGKGFEVVRSARMPPAMKARGGDLSDDGAPEGIPVAMGVLRNGPIESDDEDDAPKTKVEKQTTRDTTSKDGPAIERESGRGSESDDASDDERPRVSENPPLLPDLDAGESFRFPSRIHSTRTNRQPSQRTAKDVEIIPLPEVPRKSSKRNSSVDRFNNPSFNLVPPTEASKNLQVGIGSSSRLPFDRTNSQKRLSSSSVGATDTEMPSASLPGDSGDERPTSFGYVHQHNISRVDPSSDQHVDLLGSAAEVVESSRRHRLNRGAAGSAAGATASSSPGTGQVFRRPGRSCTQETKKVDSSMAEARISVLCSGNGSNLQALIDNCQSGRIPGRIIKVTVNKKDAYALERAAKAGIPTDYFNIVSHGFKKAGEKDEARVKEARAKYDAALAERILADKPELVVLAGWMHVFSADFLRPLNAAGIDCINLHPALPGMYDGAGAIARAHKDFLAGTLANATTGIMIHHVVEEVDRGAPILVKEIVIKEGESLEALTERIHSFEHDLVVEATAIKAKEIVGKRQA